MTWPEIGKHHEFITAQLKAGVTVKTIWQRLAGDHGLAASYASLRRYVAANVPEETRREQVRVLRLAPREPGQEAQIDYGQMGRWLDPVTGARHVVWAFVMVLCCSRHLFVRPVIRLDQHAWTECHVKAFEFFGGVPARLVPDNLKTGVDRPDLYDPKTNRAYAELAAHYGADIPRQLPETPGKPQVERPMPYIRDSFWRGRNSPPWRRCNLRGSAGAPMWPGGGPACRWRAPARWPCSRRQRRARWQRCRPGSSCSRNGGPRRSGPTSMPRSRRGCIPSRGGTSARPSMPADLHDGAVLRPRGTGQDPPAQARGKQTDLADYPPEKVAHMRTPAWCRRQAAGIGPAYRSVIGELMADNALYRLRAAQGVIGLAGKHDTGRLEAACARARGRRPVLQDHPGHPGRRTETAPGRTRPAAGAAAFLHGPDAIFRRLPPRQGPRRRCGPGRHAAGSLRTPRSWPPGPPRRPGPPGRRWPHQAGPPGRRPAAKENPVMTATIETKALGGPCAPSSSPGCSPPSRPAWPRPAPGTPATWSSSRSCARRHQPPCGPAIARRLHRARFEEQSTFEGFDFSASPGIAAAIRDLAALRWLPAGESVILSGPVGVGKTLIARPGPPGHPAGDEARFLKTSRALAHLAGGTLDATWHKRLRAGPGPPS